MRTDGRGSHPNVGTDLSRAEAADVDVESERTSVLETAEVRWFALGRVPPEVADWFTRGGTIGMVEQRCDTYRLSVRHDVGLKRRHRTIPELKVRQSIARPLALGDGPPGRHEVWRRWSPARDLPAGAGRDRWIDVHKRVCKRRFAGDGAEQVLTGAVRPMTVEGCDVEIVAVTVGEIEAWTFAFAASGPEAHRTSSIMAAWDSLVEPTPCPEGFWRAFDRSIGYPGWLMDLFPGPPGDRLRHTTGERSDLPS